MSQNKRSLDKTLAGHLERRRARSQLRHLTIVPPQAVDFSSNSYLSLSTNPAVQSDFLSRLQTYAKNAPSTTTVSDRQNVPLLGSGGSRLLDGNSALAENIERQIAEFHRAESGLFFNSAFDANVGLFGCVPQVGDVIVYDELIHASVHDGMKLSRASRRVAFAHNCVRLDQAQEGSAQTASLEAVLRHLATGDEHYFRTGKKNVFIAVEGLYSMDGDLAPLREIVECVEEYFPAGNGYIIVDEAHSTGIYGDRGRGLVCHLGLENRVWARIHGFGKAMSCTGGIVLASHTTRNYLINYARSLIYTTSMTFPSLISIQVTHQYLMDGHAERLVRHIHLLILFTHDLLTSVCSRCRPPLDILHLKPGLPESPIIPIFTSHPRSLAAHCQAQGFMVRPIVAPTVPRGSERVRICLHAGNSKDEVTGLCRAVEAWVINEMRQRPEPKILSVDDSKIDKEIDPPKSKF